MKKPYTLRIVSGGSAANTQALLILRDGSEVDVTPYCTAIYWKLDKRRKKVVACVEFDRVQMSARSKL